MRALPFFLPPMRRPRLSRDARLAELDEEFALHIAMIARELEESGLAAADAEAAARARFGDIQRFREQCMAISDGGRTMWIRILSAAVICLVILMGVSVWVGVSMYREARLAQDAAHQERAAAIHSAARAEATTAFLTEILQSQDASGTSTVSVREVLEQASARLESADLDPQTEATLRSTISDTLQRLDDASGSGLFSIDGAVARPGTYALPSEVDGFSLSRALIAAGGFDGRCRVLVYSGPAEDRTIIFEGEADSAGAFEDAGLVLRGDETIVVQPLERQSPDDA